MESLVSEHTSLSTTTTTTLSSSSSLSSLSSNNSTNQQAEQITRETFSFKPLSEQEVDPLIRFIGRTFSLGESIGKPGRFLQYAERVTSSVKPTILGGSINPILNPANSAKESKEKDFHLFITNDVLLLARKSKKRSSSTVYKWRLSDLQEVLSANIDKLVFRAPAPVEVKSSSQNDEEKEDSSSFSSSTSMEFNFYTITSRNPQKLKNLLMHASTSSLSRDRSSSTNTTTSRNRGSTIDSKDDLQRQSMDIQILNMLDNMVASAKKKQNANLKLCCESIREVWSTEVQYVSELELLGSEYERRLNIAIEISPTICTLQDKNEVFSSRPIIEYFNKNYILQPLRESLFAVVSNNLSSSSIEEENVPNYDAQELLGDVALALASVFNNNKAIEALNKYYTFCSTYGAARERIMELRKPKGVSEFDLLVSDVESLVALRHRGLDSLMIKPVQRICKYSLLFHAIHKSIEKYADEEKADLKMQKMAAQTACLRLEEVAEKVNELVARSEKKKLMMEVYEELGGEQNCAGLLQPTRSILCRENVQIQVYENSEAPTSHHGAQDGRIYLFNDIVLGACAVETGSGILLSNRSAIKTRYRNIFTGYYEACYLSTKQGEQHVLIITKGSLSMKILCGNDMILSTLQREFHNAKERDAEQKAELMNRGKRTENDLAPVAMPQKQFKRPASPMRGLNAIRSHITGGGSGGSASSVQASQSTLAEIEAKLKNERGRSPMRARFGSSTSSSSLTSSSSAISGQASSSISSNITNNVFQSPLKRSSTDPSGNQNIPANTPTSSTMGADLASRLRMPFNVPSLRGVTQKTAPTPAFGLTPTRRMDSTTSNHTPTGEEIPNFDEEGSLNLSLLLNQGSMQFGEDKVFEVTYHEQKIGLTLQESDCLEDSPTETTSRICRVQSLLAGGESEQHDVQVGDVIEAVNGQIAPPSVTTIQQMILQGRNSGSLTITFRRPAYKYDNRSLAKKARTCVSRMSELHQISNESLAVLNLASSLETTLARFDHFKEKTEKGHQKSQYDILSTLLRSQFEYVQELRTLVDSYLIPLREHNASRNEELCNSATLEAIFKNIPLLLLLDAELLRCMLKVCNEVDVQKPTEIISGFVESIKSILGYIKVYYGSYGFGDVGKLVEARGKSSRLHKFFCDIEADLLDQGSLYSLLSSPGSHMAKLSTCVSALQSVTKEDSVALAIELYDIKRHLECLSLHKNASNRLDKVLKPYEELGGEIGCPNLVNMARRYVNADDVVLSSDELLSSLPSSSSSSNNNNNNSNSLKETRRAYLFEDLLIVARKYAKQQRRSFSLPSFGVSRSKEKETGKRSRQQYEVLWKVNLRGSSVLKEVDSPDSEGRFGLNLAFVHPENRQQPLYIQLWSNDSFLKQIKASILKASAIAIEKPKETDARVLGEVTGNDRRDQDENAKKKKAAAILANTTSTTQTTNGTRIVLDDSENRPANPTIVRENNHGFVNITMIPSSSARRVNTQNNNSSNTNNPSTPSATNGSTDASDPSTLTRNNTSNSNSNNANDRTPGKGLR